MLSLGGGDGRCVLGFRVGGGGGRGGGEEEGIGRVFVLRAGGLDDLICTFFVHRLLELEL